MIKKLAVILGVTAAVLLHAGFILFGGLIFPAAKKPEGVITPIDLLSDVEEEKKETKPEDEPKEKKELEAETEQPPDATEILEKLDEQPAMDAAPALEAASLSAIEAALGGQGGSGDFADALTFQGGGVIGGTGKRGATAEAADDPFELTDIDQKPRAVFQSSPTYPPQMRGKKIEGVVSVLFVVDATGKVESPRVEKSSNAAFESPALSAVRKWKFEPGVRAGQRVASKMRVSIRFPVT